MPRTNLSTLKTQIAEEFSPFLKKQSEAELGDFLDLVLGHLNNYRVGYQHGKDLILVLDNTIIQDFKHMHDRARRRRAAAYTAFCRFVRYWSDRPAGLAVSPAVFYEHNGRRPTTSKAEANQCVMDVMQLLSVCGLPLGVVYPNQLTFSLHEQMQAVHEDADFLGTFASQIKESDWEIDLRTESGLMYFPSVFADRAIPGDMPLKYFNPRYVRQVFLCRIEKAIAEQSEKISRGKPTTAGEFTRILAGLNTFGRGGRFQGIGDIDMLQICDIGSQYHGNDNKIYIGQTSDENLDEALGLYDRLVIHGPVYVGGSPNSREVAEETVAFFRANPFAELDQRASEIQPLIREFWMHLQDLCIAAIK